jgi:hypothetical protein
MTRFAGAECVSEEGKAQCSAAAGKCIMERDGYFITTGICLLVGLIFLVAYIIPTAKRLQGPFAHSMHQLHLMSLHSFTFDKVAGCYLSKATLRYS